jgi:hypothetical protein
MGLQLVPADDGQHEHDQYRHGAEQETEFPAGPATAGAAWCAVPRWSTNWIHWLFEK